MPYTHLAEMFFDCARQAGQRVAYTYRQGSRFTNITWTKAAERVQAIASGILTLANPDPGSCVTILAPTSLEWILCDFALLSLGCKTVPIYTSLLAPEMGYIHVDTQAQIIIVANKEQLHKVRQFRQGFSFCDVEYSPEQLVLQRIIVIDPEGVEAADDWQSLAEVEAQGEKVLADTEAQRRERMQAITREDVATYCYTSGTTGPPKGVIQTHHNHLSILENVADTGIFREEIKDSGVLLFLPLAHSFGRLVEFGAAFYQTKTAIANIPTLAEDIAFCQPGFIPAAPRVFERMYAKILSSVEQAASYRQALFRWAVHVGEQTIPYRQQHQPLPALLAWKWKLANRLVFAKIRARIGLSRTVILFSGSAPLSTKVGVFFASIGPVILEAYGLTETCPGLTTNRYDRWKIGTVGLPITGVQLKLLPDGEILAKGPNVVSGYLHRPEATKEAWDEDGWFHTGDIGELDSEGFLRITDRKKDLIKTSGGKFVAPQKIESMLKSKPLISEAVVVGDERRYCVALLTIDPEAFTVWAEQRGLPADVYHNELRKQIQADIDSINLQLASFETIKYFRIINEQFSVENALLTASLKVKRKQVQERFKSLIDEMYES